MSDAITELLAAEHRQIAEWQAQARAGDAESYQKFRGALLRHIGIEEKILILELRAVGIEPPMAAQLKIDHSAFVGLLVPPPDDQIFDRISELSRLHDPLEEGEEGLYPLADRHLKNIPEILERIAQAPIPPMLKNNPDERAYIAADRLYARALESRGLKPAP